MSMAETQGLRSYKVPPEGWQPGFPAHGEPLKLKSLRYVEGSRDPAMWNGEDQRGHRVCVRYGDDWLTVWWREYGTYYQCFQARSRTYHGGMTTEDMLKRTGMEVEG